jgi:predicted Zn-dependent protease
VTSSTAKSDQPVLNLLVTILVMLGLIAAFWSTASLHPNVDGTMTATGADAGNSLATEGSINEIDQMPPMQLMREGKNDEAIAAARELVKHDQDNVKNLICAGDVLCETKQTRKDGLAYLQKSTYSAPKERWVAINYARKLAANERVEQAIAQYLAINKKFPDFTRARFEVAQLYLNNREFDDAVKVLEPARVKDVHVNYAQKQWGLVEAVTDAEDAFPDFKSGVEREIKAGYPGEVESIIQKTGSDTEKPLEEVRTAMNRKPEDIGLKLTEVQLLIAGKKLDDAKTALAKILQGHAKEPAVQLQLAELDLWNGDQAGAKTAFDEAAKLTKEEKPES